jgi:hypothetical protein
MVRSCWGGKKGVYSGLYARRWLQNVHLDSGTQWKFKKLDRKPSPDLGDFEQLRPYVEKDVQEMVEELFTTDR